MKKALTLSLILSSALFGAAYQIPNNSINSAALATANVANAHGADAAYYNPANMVYNTDNHEIESSVTYVSLSQINYKSSDGVFDIDSKKHTVFIPSFHYVSKKLNDAGVRIGFSLIAPAGLTREWKDAPAIYTAKKYSLETMEFNPTVAIPVSKDFSIAFGLRYVRASAEITLDGRTLPSIPGVVMPYYLDMEARDNSSFGYNIALSYNATEALNISATYRSKITLDLEGSGDASFAGVDHKSSAMMSVPIPANLIIAAAYTFNNATTVEITYDRTMWSAIQETNIEFEDPTMEATVGATKDKKWHDTEAYRLGVTHILNSTVTLMSGIAYSTNAADEDYVSFSSPEADSMTYALGGRYRLDDSLELGLAVLYADYDDRTSNNGTVDGKLSDRDVYTITAGMNFKF